MYDYVKLNRVNTPNISAKSQVSDYINFMLIAFRIIALHFHFNFASTIDNITGRSAT